MPLLARLWDASARDGRRAISPREGPTHSRSKGPAQQRKTRELANYRGPLFQCWNEQPQHFLQALSSFVKSSTPSKDESLQHIADSYFNLEINKTHLSFRGTNGVLVISLMLYHVVLYYIVLYYVMSWNYIIMRSSTPSWCPTAPWPSSPATSSTPARRRQTT